MTLCPGSLYLEENKQSYYCWRKANHAGYHCNALFEWDENGEYRSIPPSESTLVLQDAIRRDRYQDSAHGSRSGCHDGPSRVPDAIVSALKSYDLYQPSDRSKSARPWIGLAVGLALVAGSWIVVFMLGVLCMMLVHSLPSP